MVVFFWFGLVAAICALVYITLTWKYDEWKKRGVPGPRPWPLVGNMPGIITRKQHIVIDVDQIYRKYKNTSSVVGIFQTRNPILLVTDVWLCRDIMIRNFNSFHDNFFSKYVHKEVEPIFSQNPIAMTGDAWKEKRIDLSPAFTTNKIKTMYPVMAKCSARMVDFIKQYGKLEKNGFLASELTARLTTEVVGSCVLGLEAESFKSQADGQIRRLGREMARHSVKTLTFIFLTELIPYLNALVRHTIIPKFVADFFMATMKESKRQRLERGAQRTDYLSFLIEMQKKRNLSDMEFSAQAITFFFEAFETSRVTMANILHQLAQHRPVQERLRQEIRQLEKRDGQLTYDSIIQMPYLDQVFCESLRLCPTLSLILRKCTKEHLLPLSRGPSSPHITVKYGDAVWIPIHSIHRDEDYYPNADHFDPDRFSEANGGVQSFKEQGVYMPFGDGPRQCIGMRFATATIKTALVDLVKNFDLVLDPKTGPNREMDPAEFLNLPKGGTWIHFEPL